MPDSQRLKDILQNIRWKDLSVSSTTQTVPALPSLHDFFAPGGVLSRSQLPYEFRRGQLEWRRRLSAP